MSGQGLIAVVGLPLLAWALSEDRKAVSWRLVAAGLLLQAALALALLRLPASRELFFVVASGVNALQEATRAGTAFVFGYLGGGALPFPPTDPAASFVLAFQALPLVLLMSALSRLLFFWGILPRIVRAFALVLRAALGIGGAVGLCAAANVFVGMVEAPLLVRPYLARLSRGELFMCMTAGMATIAGTVFALYASLLSPVVADAAGHLLTASMINAPGALVIAALMVPPGAGRTDADGPPPRDVDGAMEAIAKGTAEGAQLLIGIVAMLIVLVALVALTNQILGLLPAVGDGPLTLQRLLGWPMAPLAWAMGVPWAEAPAAGALLGTKIALNELIAYSDLSRLPAGALSERSRLILVYALCGFANFGSLGIMIGGLTAMVPERRAEVVALGLRAIVAGVLATCLSGAIVGLIA